MVQIEQTKDVFVIYHVLAVTTPTVISDSMQNARHVQVMQRVSVLHAVILTIPLELRTVPVP